MDANDLLLQIKGYNLGKTEECSGYCDNLFISEVRRELEEIYNNGKWIMIAKCTQLGISVRGIEDDFKKLEIDILSSYPLYGENVHDDYELPTFKEFIESGEYKKSEICGFKGKEILKMKSFVKSLEEKGFGVYVDVDNYELVVTLDIK